MGSSNFKKIYIEIWNCIYFLKRKWYNNNGDGMIKKVKNIKINYELYGKGKETIVYLHGWGQNIEMMKPIADPFQNKFQILIIDLPGFGQSEKPDFVWQMNDYIEMLHALLQELKVKKITLVGHSFGGKLSLLYASKYEVEKLVVLAGPFKKSEKTPSLKVRTLKKLKKVPVLNKLENFAKKHIGSTDYRNADPLMRKILVNHVNLDIQKEVKTIKCPTLILWGTEDTEVPVEDAYILEKWIEDSGVVILEGGTHYAYLEFLPRVISILQNFL